MSYADAIADFIGFMEANGVVPIEPIAQRLGSGNLIRFRCEGDGKGRKNGWAILYLDERPAGAFGNYKANTGTLKWKTNSDRPALTAAEREALQREWREAREKREATRRDNETQASLDAADKWRKCPPASPDHSYAAAKNLDVTGLKQEGNRLLVPMCDEAGTLWNLQAIGPDGTKRFLRGGRIDGLFAIIGQFATETAEAVFVEGYSTGSTVHRATGLPVIVTFNTANMPKVARLWADLRPDLAFTVFADDDEQTARSYVDQGKPYKNPGIETAEAVAAEIGAHVAYPLGKPQGRAA
jgi:putative DNA primase/helicase